MPDCDNCQAILTEAEAADSMLCDDCWDKQMEEWKKEQEHLEREYWDSVL